MQNTQQPISAEYVINMVWDFMNRAKGHFKVDEIFTSILAVLYTYHKRYAVRVYDNRRIEFTPCDDKLYNDLVCQIPDDQYLHVVMCDFMQNLTFIDYNEFNMLYVEVLTGLFDLVSCNSGRESGDFYTPTAITKLMAYIANKENCNEVFDPFCGTASIVHEMYKLGSLPHFVGQELNRKTSIYARVVAEALYTHDECIYNVNSITHWDDCIYDAVITCPPLNLRLTQEQLHIARHVIPECPSRNYEEIILTRPFHRNHARMTITHLPTTFCYRGTRDSFELRRELVERNLVDMIIALPGNILYGTSIPSVILVCKRNRNVGEPVKFIHAEEYFLGDRRKRTFDYNRFVEMFEDDGKDVVKVSLHAIREYEYNLNPSLYVNHFFDLKEGQRVVNLGELISLVEGDRITSEETEVASTITSLSKDFIEILLNNSKLSKVSENRRITNYRCIDNSGKKYILSSSVGADVRYGLFTDQKGFNYSTEVKVFEVNEALVTPEYLVYQLVNNEAINNSRMSLTEYMWFPIVIDSIDKQKELVSRITQRYREHQIAEHEADAQRLGIKQNVSDLEHMLGTTQIRIGKIIQRLENATPVDVNYSQLVKQLKDNFEYMNRTIQYTNARIDSACFNKQDGDILRFVQGYVNAWNNYGSNCFVLDVLNELSEPCILSFDKSMLTVMLDSILNNAVRHGFHKRKKDGNQVMIRLSEVSFKDKPYLLLSVANNGEAIADEFSIEDYISRGRFTASTGRSGLGGYHVHQIVKGHNGYLRLDSNKQWNVVVEALLPTHSSKVNDLTVYEYECI